MTFRIGVKSVVSVRARVSGLMLSKSDSKSVNSRPLDLTASRLNGLRIEGHLFVVGCAEGNGLTLKTISCHDSIVKIINCAPSRRPQKGR